MPKNNTVEVLQMIETRIYLCLIIRHTTNPDAKEHKKLKIQTMIDQSARDLLLQKAIRQDWDRAAQIYARKNSRTIYPRYLEKFLRGQRNPTGRKRGAHQPLDMFDAIATAIAEREEAERQQTAQALRILQSKMRIEPIPLAI
jgi:hypothetical protein